jgi:hypothetical protein
MDLGRVQNPCPKQSRTTSDVIRVLRRSRAWVICSAMPASAPPNSSHSSRSTRWSAPAASGSSPKPRAAPAPTALSSSSSWTSCARATPWWSGSWTASAGPCATWSTPSPGWPTVASGCVAFRRRSTPLPRAASWSSTSFAALAEFERDLIRECTTAGLAAARARGRHGSRPSVLTGHKLQVAQEMYRSGEYSVEAIAKTLGVSRASIYRHLTRPAS